MDFKLKDDLYNKIEEDQRFRNDDLLISIWHYILMIDNKYCELDRRLKKLEDIMYYDEEGDNI